MAKIAIKLTLHESKRMLGRFTSKGETELFKNRDNVKDLIDKVKKKKELMKTVKALKQEL